jgi:small subunit ribosomal protein S7
MPRHSFKRKQIKNDPIYDSFEIAKLINYIMIGGKKSVAQSAVYKALDRFKESGEEPMKILHKALSNVSPQFEVKPRRLGGASYLVPTEVRRERKLYLSLHWIIDAARSRANKDFHRFEDKLHAELTDAANNLGQAVAKKAQAEKLAEANKAFSHLKW